MAGLEWHGEQAAARAREGAAAGLTKAAELVLTVSNTRVPLDEATLMRSGVAHPASAGSLESAVSYDTVYAARQHEELTWRHPNGRQAKYLESAVNDSADAVLALIGAEVRRALA